MEILKRYRSPNKSSRRGEKVALILIHSTEGRFPGCAEWLCNLNSGVSAHYLITREARIYNLVEESLSAWHAGRSAFDFDGNGIICENEKKINRRSIGIELEGVGGDYTAGQLAALKELVQDLLVRYWLGHDRVVGHREVAPGRKTDPVGLEMDLFRRRLFRDDAEV